jgi:hypothetical protein
MQRIVLALGIIAGLLVNLTAADACGDKTLRIGRGARFQRTAHAAAVLIYVPSDAPATAVERAPRLQSFLKRVGHKAQVVRGTDKLSEVLNSGQYDLVLGNLADFAGLQKQIEASASKPVLVPVISRGTKAEVATAQKQYKYIVKNPNSGDEYLDAIEEAMRSRLRILAKKV